MNATIARKERFPGIVREGMIHHSRRVDRFETLFNLAEGVLWSLIAVAMALGALRHAGRRRRILAVAAVAFAVFGGSDWIEAETGSWWEPPWLLALKASCLFVLLLALKAWQRLAKIKNSQEATQPVDATSPGA